MGVNSFRNYVVKVFHKPVTFLDTVHFRGGKPYKYYIGLMSQLYQDAPTVIILENTIGEIVWTRVNTGVFRGTLAGAFVDKKTWCYMRMAHSSVPSVVGYSSMKRYNDDFIEVTSGEYDPPPTTLWGRDGILWEVPFEIRVYP